MAKKKKKSLSKEEVLLKYGVRSGLEVKISQQLDETDVEYGYESLKLPYVQPEKKRSYTPDYIFEKKSGGVLVVEGKGRLTLQDRQKMVWIKGQHPDVDFRFVFSNSKAKISKASKTTYGAWADQKGFPYADKLIPQEWLDECTRR